MENREVPQPVSKEDCAKASETGIISILFNNSFNISFVIMGLVNFLSKGSKFKVFLTVSILCSLL